MIIDRIECDKRADDFLKIHLHTLSLPTDFSNLYQTLVYIPPKGIGGNHRHPRREIFLSLSDALEIYWIDGTGKILRQKMKEKNQIYVFDIRPFVPHAIINTCQQSAGVLLELTDDLQKEVEPYLVVQTQEFSRS